MDDPALFMPHLEFTQNLGLTLKIHGHLVKTIVKKYRCVQALHRHGTTVVQAYLALGISRSGYYG